MFELHVNLFGVEPDSHVNLCGVYLNFTSLFRSVLESHTHSFGVQPDSHVNLFGVEPELYVSLSETELRAAQPSVHRRHAAS